MQLPSGDLARLAALPVNQVANHDPPVFPAPDRLVTGHAPHPGFGRGVHFCLGAPLARMELQEALQGARRTPSELPRPPVRLTVF
ncbi:hypothetical protein [Sinosporangium siamense]|uniref:Cytochrome P450 n=1 Tax=Sinosporangium siamense TaxID=1367973 RepID=A0A919REU8_9ACTN|nr:hypothetical protein [Sinosporangium siamense]GII90489.1 hypothetical protein Ssi02_07200 [Sinosporangium siamense]